MQKLALFVALVLTLLCVAPQSTDANTFREVKQLQTQAALHASPSSSAKVIVTLPTNTLVTHFSTTNGWAYVHANQHKGFVQASALKVPTSVIKVASSKSGLVVKETASRSSKSVATLQYNMIVEDFGTVPGGWTFVQYGNVTGYVNTAFIGVPKTVSKTVTTNDYLRNIASTSGSNKGNVTAGMVVTEHSQIAGWSYVSTGSIRGYMPTRHLKVTAPPASAQQLTSFSAYRPSKISWMQYYVNITEEYDGDVVSGNLSMNNYDGHYSYHVGSAVEDAKPPVTEYHTDSFYLGIPYSDFVITAMEAPMTRNVAKPSYYFSVGSDPILIGNFYLRHTNTILTTPAGTFTNVLHIEEKYYNDPDSSHYYFAPGYGLIKWVSSKGILYFELRSYR